MLREDFLNLPDIQKYFKAYKKDINIEFTLSDGGTIRQGEAVLVKKWDSTNIPARIGKEDPIEGNIIITDNHGHAVIFFKEWDNAYAGHKGPSGLKINNSVCGWWDGNLNSNKYWTDLEIKYEEIKIKEIDLTELF